ncbi:hypothetical protein C1Y63_10560 [Corynebacterium sp. 13CS0277]|uniref:phage major capsid protein n=1 Tax=Corynebacterium sp. 13CS0277 TaxID=2071994 RepID=UPI000D03639A|nr:hypothetical protein [Corynebacterium sp. 13CS0277]PRQ10627.1 hypothetical protein C1Y63_10560 [Corynebacterium sp. 13CS0277]
MDTIVASAYDGQNLTVAEMLKDPTYIPTRVVEGMQGQFLAELLFRNGGTNDGVVAFREAASPYLNLDAQEVAEFAEIPVANLAYGALHSVVGVKTALAIRISREMIRENRVDQVAAHLEALNKTMVKTDVKAAVDAFVNNDAVAKVGAGAKWAAGADPIKDVLDAVEKIQGAEAPGGAYFDYVPDTMVLHPMALTALLRNEQVQRFYVGDNASENPVYTGLESKTLFGLNVATSRFMDPAQVIVMEAGAVGFYSDTDPLQATPMYEEGGASGAGGPRQTWRADMWRKRILGVDNPKAAVVITGVK